MPEARASGAICNSRRFAMVRDIQLRSKKWMVRDRRRLAAIVSVMCGLFRLMGQDDSGTSPP
jgi:hypothetical protein